MSEQITTTDKKCPSCGATLKYDPATRGLSCEFCGRQVAITQQIQPPGVGYTLEELNNAAGAHYLQKSKVAVCGTCGGRFIIQAMGITGLCPYCGSNSLNETDEETGMLEPTGILPFQITKEQGEKIFSDWIAKARFAPADLKTKTTYCGLTGVYVPYWVFDANTFSSYHGKFGRTYGSGDDQYTKWHKSSGVFELKVKDNIIIASQRLAGDRFWNGISKFNLNFLKKYDPDLLSGFMAERYTIDGSAAWLTSQDQIRGMIRRGIIDREVADCVDKLEFEPEYANVRAKYILAPVWVTSFQYNNQIYRVLINGQTGAITGTSPKSLRWLGKIFMIIGIVMGAIFATEILMMIIRSLMTMGR